MQELARRVLKLEGQLLATQIALRGLIAAHPDPDQAIASVLATIERFAAAGLASEAPDLVLDGLDNIRGRVLPDDTDLTRERLRASRRPAADLG